MYRACSTLGSTYFSVCLYTRTFDPDTTIKWRHGVQYVSFKAVNQTYFNPPYTSYLENFETSILLSSVCSSISRWLTKCTNFLSIGFRTRWNKFMLLHSYHKLLWFTFRHHDLNYNFEAKTEWCLNTVCGSEIKWLFYYITFYVCTNKQLIFTCEVIFERITYELAIQNLWLFIALFILLLQRYIILFSGFCTKKRTSIY